jgi:predicted acetylornithine/succinylornithine family transaminase
MNTDEINSLFVPTYARSGAPMVKGKGMYLIDADGKKYLDFGSGISVNALGHAHPGLIKALVQQGKALLHTSNLYFNQPQIDFAKLLIKHSFGERVFLCNSGTEANEAAIKFARKWATLEDRKKYHILSFTDSFHGRTYGGLSATAQEKFHAGFKPIMSGFHYAPFNDIEATTAMLAKHKFAAIFIEPLQGESGINVAATEFLKFLREYATEHRIALVFDEVQCGVGRTGTLWHYEQHGVTPDIMTLAKPIGGGLPLGAVVCTEEVALALKPGEHGSTFGGNPLACALGCVVLSTVAQKSFLKAVRTNGAYLKTQLETLAKSHPEITSVHGSGLMIGVRFEQDPKKLIGVCKALGLLVIHAGHNTVRFMPALTATKEDIDKAVKIFGKALKVK